METFLVRQNPSDVVGVGPGSAPCYVIHAATKRCGRTTTVYARSGCHLHATEPLGGAMNRWYLARRRVSVSCVGIALAILPGVLQATTYRVTPTTSTASNGAVSAFGLGCDSGRRTPVCGTTEADSSTFEVCLENDTFEFGDEIRFEYRVTNDGVLPRTYVMPTLCQERFGLTPAGCEWPTECGFFWDTVDGCFQLPSSFMLSPGETKSFELYWAMHQESGAPIAPGDYQLWGGLYAYGDTGVESYASVPFQVVPYGPQPIQDALALASAGDTVLVAAGTYAETVVFGGGASGVTLLSESGPEVTILDGGQRGSAVYFRSTNLQTVLEGFTITNGRGGCPSNPSCVSAAEGGGISVVQNASVQIRDNWIRDNSSTASGAGIGIASAATVNVDGNLFLHNAASGSGGAIHRRSSSGGTIDHNTFVENEAGGNGGAVRVADSPGAGTVNFRFNIFAGNTAGVAGGGVSCSGSTAEFCNLFWVNSPDEFAGCSSSQSAVADPLFCSPPMERFGLREGSPGLPENSACGSLIGAFELDCDVSDVPEGSPAGDATGSNGTFAPGALTAWPNPSRDTCTLRYAFPQTIRRTAVDRGADVELSIYDTAGRCVREYPIAGTSGVVEWDGRSTSGRPVPSGVYWARLRAAGSVIAACPVLRVE